MMSLFRNFKKSTDGNVAIMFAASVVAILIGAGVAIDASMAHKTKVKLQNTADSAVLAAAKSGETDQQKLQQLAEQYVGINGGDASAYATTLSLTPNGRVRVGVKTKYDTQFGGVIGKSDINISVVSEAPLSTSQPVDIALVLDVTGSMSGQKLTNLKSAATDLITSLDASGANNYNVSIVPFAQYVNVGPAHQNANWLEFPGNASGWAGCVGSRATPWHQRARYAGNKIPAIAGNNCPTALLPLTNDTVALKAKIDAFSAQGWTYIPAGLAWGWRTLDAQAPFSVPSSGTNTKKVLVLMTDGENTKSKNGVAHNGNSTQAANAVTKKLCQNINSTGIEIYTIAYEISDTPTKNLMRKCATKPDMYFDASNSGQLEDAFEAIGSNLIKLRLTH